VARKDSTAAGRANCLPKKAADEAAAADFTAIFQTGAGLSTVRAIWEVMDSRVEKLGGRRFRNGATASSKLASECFGAIVDLAPSGAATSVPHCVVDANCVRFLGRSGA